MKIIAQML